MNTETVFIELFIAAITVAIVVRRLHIPYTVGLVLAGLLIGVMRLLQAPLLTKDLLFSIFLPGLLFEAAFHIEFKDFWQNRITIVALAIPGVIAATALTAIILTPVASTLHFAQGFTWQYALVFGALISATDPIAVLAIFRTLGIPKRLSVLLDGESLLNDGTAIVFFTLSLLLVSENMITPEGLAFNFITIVGAGALIGTIIGLIVSQVIRQVDDPMIEITLTTVAAYGSFLLADQLNYSGVIATVAAGLLCGNYAARTGMSPSTRIAVETFWGYVAFALNSIVFLLIGLEIHLDTLLASWQLIVVAYFVVVMGRSLIVLGVSSFLSFTREKIPPSWSVVIIWGGMRGGLPMVLALSLPPAFPYRNLLITMTFGVVILSILIQGLTMSPLLQGLGIVSGFKERTAYELIRGQLQAANAALVELDHMSHIHFANAEVLSTLRQEYADRVYNAKNKLDELHLEKKQLSYEETRWARRHLILVEKDEVNDAFYKGIISQEIREKLLADIDARLLELESA
jgi:CPA1 family monovalent cation:H+ antiporter